MKKCKYCQTEIDSSAKVCPNCKKDQRNWVLRHPVWSLLIGLLLLGLLISSGDTEIDSKSTSSVSQQEQSSDKSDTSKKEEKLVKVSEDLQIGMVKWNVVKAWETTQLTDYSGVIKPTGKFVVINVRVENLDKEMKTVSGLKLVDNQNREFISYSKSSLLKNLGAEPLFLISNINPNVPLVFADVYEVPADAKGLKLRVGDLSLLGSDEGFIDLGL